MDSATATFDALLAADTDKTQGPGPNPAAPAQDDLYSSVMAKEASVLELVRRLDDTRRAEAMKASDKVAPMVMAFAEGVSAFVARLMHYMSSGATKEAIALVSSPDGMIYAGTLVLLFSILLIFL